MKKSDMLIDSESKKRMLDDIKTDKHQNDQTIESLRLQLEKAKHHTDIDEIYKKIISNESVIIDDYLKYAIFLRNAKKIQESLDVLDGAEKRFSKTAWIEDNRSRACILVEKFNEAAQHWENSCNIATKQEKKFFCEELNILYGRIFKQISIQLIDLKFNNEWDSVIDILNQYKSYQIHNLYLYLELAIAYRNKRDFINALNTLKEAEEIGLESAWIHDNYARIYFDQKQYQKAIDECNIAIQISESESEKNTFTELLKLSEKHLDTNADVSNKMRLQGCLDVCGKEGIHGWIMNLDAPNECVEIEIFIDDELAIKTIADLFRQDLLDAGISNGYSGFNAPMPSQFLDDLEHSIKIKEAESGALLNIKNSRFTEQMSDDAIDRYLHYLIKQRKIIPQNINFNELHDAEQQLIIKSCYPLIDINYIKNQEPFSKLSLKDIYKAVFGALVNPHPLFDNEYYELQAELKGVDVECFPLLHYLTVGWKIGLDPHPLFDGSYYRIDLNAASVFDKEIDPLTAFILSKEDGKCSPSPFVDLLHLRHIMKMTFDYEFSSDANMLVDALDMEWVSIHPHIDRAMVSFLINRNIDSTAFENPKATLLDFCDLMSHIRNGKPYTYKEKYNKNEINISKVTPSLSTLILNFNKPIYTILSAFSVFNATQHLNHTECLVIDNGSDPFFVELLYRYCKNMETVNIVSLKENRFFGEGNNIGFDYSKGDRVLFLNNDAIIRPETIEQLLNTLDNDSTLGAIAPIMVLPNGQIQEAGGTISGCGQIIQKSKFTPFNTFVKAYRASSVRYCDYASAAACLMPRHTLEKILGFDYIFEPFYFEDTDLCARIKAQGFKVAVCLDAYAMHIENASTKEFLGDSFGGLIGQQRKKFNNRWNGIYEDISYQEDVAAISARYTTSLDYHILTDFDVNSGYSTQSVAWVYTPFDIAIGGGERYIISLAVALSGNHETWLLTKRRYSRARLAMVMEDLGIHCNKIHLATLDSTGGWQRPDIYVTMGNEIEPQTAPLGKYNVFHCQFPFPIHQCGHFACERINHYDAILVNSHFTANNIKQAIEKYRLKTLPIFVVAPPVAVPDELVQQESLAKKLQTDDPITIVNIGRFAQGGHDKRQDIVLQIAELCAAKGLEVNFEIYGGVSNRSADMEHFANLSEWAAKAGVKIRGNASRVELSDALTRAKFYIHPCGLGCYPNLAPEKIEHFGITIVEAMAYGAIPLVYKWGGPAEILESVQVGGMFETVEEAVELIEREIQRPALELSVLAEKARQASRQFGEERFAKEINELVAIKNNNVI